MRNAKRSALIAAAVAAGLVQFRLANAATTTWDGGGVDNNWMTALNWANNSAPAASDVLVLDGFTRLTPSNDFPAGTVFGGITFNAGAGAFVVGGNSITLGGDITDNTPVLPQTINLAMALNATRNVSVTDTTGFLTLGGVISGGGFGLNKLGTGTLTLTGANTFTGPLSINAGVVRAGADTALGGDPGGPSAGRLVINGGTLRSTASFTIDANRGISLGNAGGGSGSMSLATGQSITYNGIIANNGGSPASLVKYGYGTLNLGGANSYTGSTMIKNGHVILNHAAAGAPTSNIISSSSNLVLGGATAGLGQESNSSVIMLGAAGGTNTQNFNGTNIDIYSSVIRATNGAGGTARINLGALTHTPGGNVVVPTESGTVNTTTTNTRGILGGWALAGTSNTTRGITQATDWASVDGSGNIVPYTGYVAAPLVGASNWNVDATLNADANKNVRFVATAANQEMRVAAENANVTYDINTFNYQTAGQNNHVLTIGTGNTLRLGVHGGIFKSTNGNQQIFIGGTGGTPFVAGPNANAGKITAGGAANTPGEIVVTLNEAANNSGGITIVSDIVDNGTGAVTVVKSGVASAKFDGHNTHTGGTYINQGRFQLAGSEQLRHSVDNTLTMGNPDGLGTGPVFVAPGANLFMSGINGTGTYTGNGAIAGALPNTAQNAPVVNNMTISGSGTNQEPIGAIRIGARTILSGQITLGGDARVSGSQAAAYPAINPDLTTLYVDPGINLSGRITGPFNFDVGSNVSIATNFMISNATNDWNGDTTFVSGGGTTRLRLGANEVIPDGAGKGNLVWGPLVSANLARLDMNGFSETVNGLSTTTANLGSAGIENNGFTATILDPTPGDKTDDNQTYQFTAATSTLTVGGFNQTATYGGTIRDSDAAATVTLPNPNFEGPVDPEADPATITVTPWVNVTTGTTAKVAITKIGTGIQTLTGNNPYTGDTAINGGVLMINGVTDQTKITVNSGGALGGIGTVGSVTINSGGHVAAGTSIGNINVGSLDVKTGGDLAVELGAGISDTIIVAGDATFSSGTTITPTGVPTANTYTILTAGNLTLTSNPTVNPLPTIPNARPASIALNTLTANQLRLVVTGGAENLNWTGATNSTWDVGASGTPNWFVTSGSGANPRFFHGDTVNFLDGPTNRNVVLSAALGALQPGNITVSNSGGVDYTFSGTGHVVTDLLTKNGGGRLTLSNTGVSSIGTMAIGGGTVTIANNNNIGTVVVGGVLHFGNTTPNTIGLITNNNIVEIGATGVAGLGESGTSPIANNAQVIIRRPDDVTVANPISGGGQLIKEGAGTATVSGNSSYTGATIINNGTVKVTNSNSLGDLAGGGGPVEVMALGAVDFGGNGTNNQLNFSAGTAPNIVGKSFNIRGDGPTGLGALVNTGVPQQNALRRIIVVANSSIGGTARFDIRGSTNADPQNIANDAQLLLNNNTLTKNGTNQFSIVNTDVSDGNFTVNSGTLAIEAATNMAGSGLITVNSLNAGTATAMQFFANIGNLARPMQFNAANGGTIVMGNASGNLATVASDMALNTTVNVMGLNGQNAGSLVLNGVLSGSGGITKTTGTTLLLNGINTYTGGTQVDGGTLHVSTAAIIGPGNLGAGTGGFANFVAGRTDSIKVAGLTTSGTGMVDLNDNDMIIGSNTTLAQVGAQIASARNNGNWDGGGLTSSTARALGPTGITGLGAISGADYAGPFGHGDHLFNGVSFLDTDTLVKYTYNGDANFSGNVNFDDYVRIDIGFNTNLTGWANGDFNYSGSVNFDDYVMIDVAFNTQSGTLGRAVQYLTGEDRGSGGMDNPALQEVAEHFGQFGAPYASAFLAAVPEPSTLAVLGLPVLAGMARRRRRQR